MAAGSRKGVFREMGKGIRGRIFMLVISMLVVFPIASFLVFSRTAGWYMEKMAVSRVEKLLEYVKQEAETAGFSENGADLTEEEAREASKSMLARIKKRIGKRKVYAQLMVFNRKFLEIYPENANKQEASGIVSERWQEMLKNGEFSGNGVMHLSIGEAQYAVGVYEVSTDQVIRPKYFVAYERIPNASAMLERTKKLIAVIDVIMMAIFGLFAWWIAKSILKPIDVLCRRTAEIGKGERTAGQDGPFSIRELEQLRLSFDGMEERLLEAQAEKDRIFQNISHDLRTPLASITGYAEGIQCGIMEDQKKAAGIILAESRRMNRLVDSILTLSKLDSHAWRNSEIRIPLGDFLDEQTEALLGAAGGKKLSLKEKESGEIMIKTDPDLLARIFQNVAANCLRYAKTEVETDYYIEGTYAVIAVTDDGPGIDEEEMDHLFERYYQGKKGNFGIGLSLVKSGMECLGGRVEIANRKPPEHGAVYRLYLRLSAEEKRDIGDSGETG